MSTLSVRDIQGLGTYGNTVRVPSGHSLEVDGKFILPTYTNVSALPSNSISGELAFVSETGQVFVWTGVSWVAMGGGLIGYSAANAATSPSQILTTNPSATNGAYWYNFGSGAVQIYTDFTNGGYLLAGKIASYNTDSSGPWNYSGANWSATSEVNSSAGANINNGDCVTKAYYEYNLTTGFRMCLGTPSNALTEPFSGNTARSRFTGSQLTTTNNRSQFLSWFSTGTGTSSSVFDNQPYCNQGGFNHTSVSAVTMRWGWTMNNENDCNSNDSAIGFGTATNNNYGVRNVSAGGHRWNPDERFPAQGFIFVK